MFVIVDYGVGNLTSVQNMLKKAGVSALITGNYDEVRQADKILLPGMGAFDNCMEKLDQSGLRGVIEEKVLVHKTPVLGICVGLQMFMAGSEEGKLPGLGWIKGQTVRFKQEQMDSPRTVPNMGWLDVYSKKGSPLLQGLDEAHFYFAHSYHVRVDNADDALLEAAYGYPFTVGIEKDNIVGVQFHPEKSHRFGMKLLENFANLY